jgi:hypothetical protein
MDRIVISGWFGYRVFQRGWKCLAKDLVPLLGIGVPMLLLSWAVASLSANWSPLGQMATVSLTVACLGLILTKLLMPEILREVAFRLKPFWRAFLRCA